MKKVTFSDKIVIFEIDDSDEYRSARNGSKWLHAALDRNREFQKLVKNVSLILNNILGNKIKKIALLNDVRYIFTPELKIFMYDYIINKC